MGIVTKLTPRIVEVGGRGGPLGDVRPAGPRPGIALLAAAPPAAAAQALRGSEPERAAVERLIDRLDTRRRPCAAGDEVGADRLGGTP